MGHSRKDTAYDFLDDTHFNGDLGGYVTLAEESLNRRLKQEGMLSRMEQQDQELFSGSLREQVRDLDTVRAMLPKTGRGAQNVEVELEFTDEEVEDMLTAAEFAWPGRPMLDRMLREEVSNAKGAIIVACECPPSFPHFQAHVILIWFPRRLRSDSVDCFDKEDRHGPDQPLQDQEGRQDGLHRMRDGGVRLLRFGSGVLDPDFNSSVTPLATLQYGRIAR